MVNQSQVDDPYKTASAEQVLRALPERTALGDFIHYSHSQSNLQAPPRQTGRRPLAGLRPGQGPPPICVPLGPPRPSTA